MMKRTASILIFCFLGFILNAQKQTKTITVVEFFLKEGNYTFIIDDSQKTSVAFVKKTNSKIVEKYNAKGTKVKDYFLEKTTLPKYNDFIDNEIKYLDGSLMYLDQQPMGTISDACKAFLDGLTDKIGGGLLSAVIACKEKLCSYADCKANGGSCGNEKEQACVYCFAESGCSQLDIEKKIRQRKVIYQVKNIKRN